MFQCRQASASRRSSFQLVTLHTVLVTPKRSARISPARMTSRRIDPKPSSWTGGRDAPFPFFAPFAVTGLAGFSRNR